jgi:hypothetical protein
MDERTAELFESHRLENFSMKRLAFVALCGS